VSIINLLDWDSALENKGEFYIPKAKRERGEESNMYITVKISVQVEYDMDENYKQYSYTTGGKAEISELNVPPHMLEIMRLDIEEGYFFDNVDMQNLAKQIPVETIIKNNPRLF